MNLLLFIVVLLTSFIIVRIGAIAFQLTGLEWSLAKFQALSCFSGTGFTTRESELIVSNPQRRKIATVLMVFGNAGLVTMIATFANSIRPRAVEDKMAIPFLEEMNIPAWLIPWISLAVITVIMFVMYKLFSKSRYAYKLTNLLRKIVLKRDIVKMVSFEELLVTTGGYGVSRLTICKDSPILGKMLSDANLRSYDINVLAVVRDGRTIANPKADIIFVLGDELICFGKLGQISSHICGQNN